MAVHEVSAGSTRTARARIVPTGMEVDVGAGGTVGSGGDVGAPVPPGPVGLQQYWVCPNCSFVLHTLNRQQLTHGPQAPHVPPEAAHVV